ncbi:MAG: hypothetical protein IIU46_03105 [Treponema sp.]|nr:hypothetical protein [Treponema sp.]
MEKEIEEMSESVNQQPVKTAKRSWFENFYRWMKLKLKKLWKYIYSEIKDVKTFIIFAIVVAVVYSPVWFCYILYFLFKWKWCFVVASSCLAFWAGPFTPFFPLCIAITLGIKKLLRRIFSKKQNQDEEKK